MSSEELEQRYPDNRGRAVGDLEVFECQLVTLKQFADHGIVPSRDYGEFSAQKCDTLVISRHPTVHVVMIGERKKPGELNEKNWKKVAKDALLTKCTPTGATLGFVTDGLFTRWFNGAASEVIEILCEDGSPMPGKVDFADKAFQAALLSIVARFDPTSGLVLAKARLNPEALAREVWQTVWRLKADRPEDCLATFVEIFVYKFLNDLGLMKKNPAGVDISVEALLKIDRDKAYTFYVHNIRPHIKALFPAGPDGYSIINGIVLQASNRDHNLMFHEIVKKFERFGSLRNTAPEFKTRLYESFLQESKTTTTFGQFFTPRKVVAAIHDMAGVGTLVAGKEICDPAAGVGGFVLEQMAKDLDSQWKIRGNTLTPLHKWHAYEIVPKTAILAKANALVHCGDLLADQPSRIRSVARWLRDAFVCQDKTSLGSLELMKEGAYDLIMTNPPFVVSGSADISKLIKANNKRRKYFGRKASGVEGLFVQFVVQALKVNGDAWILLPETLLLRTTDASLRDWMLRSCTVDLIAVLPERTFFNTPKRVVICHLRRRPKELSEAALERVLAKERVLLFAVSEIGETRDAKRFPTTSDLPLLAACYRAHTAGTSLPAGTKRGVSVSAKDLYGRPSINLRHFWERADARELGLLGAEEDPVEARRMLNERVAQMKDAVRDWEETGGRRATPATPLAWRSVTLGDASLFALKIGKRVLKKDIRNARTGVPLFSANVREAFGYLAAPNAGGLEYGGTLWSLDTDFDCRPVAPGEVYAITDHCGEIALKVQDIDPRYFARQLLQAGMDQGFSRDYRPSLGLMAALEVALPVKDDGHFDLELMVEWAEFADELEVKAQEMAALAK